MTDMPDNLSYQQAFSPANQDVQAEAARMLGDNPAALSEDEMVRNLLASLSTDGDSGAGESDDISAEELYADYSARIDIDLGDESPDLAVYDKEDLEPASPVTPPTVEELHALAEAEAELDTRWGERQIAPDLARMERLMDILGHPEQACPVIQVAGTNGKTSTTRMIEAVLRAMGQRVGRTTSPHLQSPTERISVDGAPISPRRYVELWEEIKPFVEMVDAWSLSQGGPRMTKFEVVTAMAFACFADTPVDVVVAEVGMGGRWDATSVATPEVGVICPIGMDHMDYLGDTLAEIAAEKAGIMSPAEESYSPHNPHGMVVIIGRQDPVAMDVIVRRAVETQAVVARLGVEFTPTARNGAAGGQVVDIQGLAGDYTDIFLPLYGTHQVENAAVALAAVEAFYGANPSKPLYSQAVHNGFAAARSPGRLERVRTAPIVMLDAAHNPQGAQALAATLGEDFHFSHLVGVVGILADKDAHGILTALDPVLDKIVVTSPASPRALSVEELKDIALQVCDERKVDTAPTVADAIEMATAEAESGAGDGSLGSAGVIITGSVVTVGQARTLLGGDPA